MSGLTFGIILTVFINYSQYPCKGISIPIYVLGHKPVDLEGDITFLKQVLYM